MTVGAFSKIERIARWATLLALVLMAIQMSTENNEWLHLVALIASVTIYARCGSCDLQGLFFHG